MSRIPVLISLALSLALAPSGCCNSLQKCNLKLEAEVGIVHLTAQIRPFFNILARLLKHNRTGSYRPLTSTPLDTVLGTPVSPPHRGVTRYKFAASVWLNVTARCRRCPRNSRPQTSHRRPWPFKLRFWVYSCSCRLICLSVSRVMSALIAQIKLSASALLFIYSLDTKGDPWRKTIWQI